MFKNKNTCLFYSLRESRFLRKHKVNHEIKLFIGFAPDALALHMYIFLPLENATLSYVPNSFVGHRTLLTSFLRVLRFFFPFSGHVLYKNGDYYHPSLFRGFHCKSIAIRRYIYG